MGLGASGLGGTLDWIWKALVFVSLAPSSALVCRVPAAVWPRPEQADLQTRGGAAGREDDDLGSKVSWEGTLWNLPDAPPSCDPVEHLCHLGPPP